VATMSGWTRGIVQLDEYLIIGISQARSSVFDAVTVNKLAQPGIAVVELATGAQVEFVAMDVREIFDIAVAAEGLK